MNPPQIILTTAVAVLVSAGVASAADAPVISAQHTHTGTAPVSVPGTGVHRGDKLPAGAKLVYRTVTLSRGQKPEVTLTAPAGKTVRGLAVSEGKVGFVVVRPRDYVGKRKVTVRSFLAPKAGDRESGRIYALIR
jgi:hypothetical protein